MCSMDILFIILVALTEAFASSDNKDRLSRSSILPSSLSSLNRSNTVQYGYCESEWTYFSETDACYKNFFSATFHEAESLCRNLNGHLTSIHSRNENSFVAALSKMGMRISTNKQGIWIGLVRSDYLNSNRKDNWTWTDGTKVDFLAWGPGAPDDWEATECCVSMLPDPFEEKYHADSWYQRWDDQSCAVNLRSFVCKKMALHCT
ncbi:unnamed protein product [Cylicocyclus nassatus]|uniref:C-type lectin domain-containing protein n=1 Tax=Cylicocyclus nassatus TaxID=53992 RepID=A0AA36H151_CYLNA|nr:unnamed protein product [Cylicocyclus nassatus]